MNPKLRAILWTVLAQEDGIIDDHTVDMALTSLEENEGLAIDFAHEALSEMSDKQFLCTLHDAAVDSGNTANRAIRRYMTDLLRAVDYQPEAAVVLTDDVQRARAFNAEVVRYG